MKKSAWTFGGVCNDELIFRAFLNHFKFSQIQTFFFKCCFFSRKIFSGVIFKWSDKIVLIKKHA